MATTTNYAWTTPDNSGLVKNGAQDIRTLGSAVDTSLWNVGYGQAGKNKIINGNFGIWQRGTSFSNPASLAYTADRWAIYWDGTGATRTISQQTFTPGTAPVAGYEGTYFLRYAVSVAGTSNSANILRQFIEDVRVFAGQTVTVSFWAKAAASTTMPSLYTTQNFGTGGSSGIDTAITTNVALTTSWQRFSYSVAIPSVAGKTIGTNSALELRFGLPSGSNTYTIDFWGVQYEVGSTATPFQTASGTIQGELALCQRYYVRYTDTGQTPVGFGMAASTTVANSLVQFPVEMRINPTAIDVGGNWWVFDGVNVISIGSFSVYSSNRKAVIFQGTGTGFTAFRSYFIIAQNSTTAYIGFTAEL